MNEPEDPSLLIAATLFLMTRHARGCPLLTRQIVDHLNYIRTHPAAGVSSVLRDVCSRLIDQWQAMPRPASPAPADPPWVPVSSASPTVH